FCCESSTIDCSERTVRVGSCSQKVSKPHPFYFVYFLFLSFFCLFYYLGLLLRSLSPPVISLLFYYFIIALAG
ncbi:hypothetical protein BX661DRAFT_189828, partial [Kickxella alabastrina]|uniref:uncharacterized protein n=1 Tax=Kickxella alabastrina TaxID=61397 RepID=UPI00221F317E